MFTKSLSVGKVSILFLLLKRTFRSILSYNNKNKATYSERIKILLNGAHDIVMYASRLYIYLQTNCLVRFLFFFSFFILK